MASRTSDGKYRSRGPLPNRSIWEWRASASRARWEIRCGQRLTRQVRWGIHHLSTDFGPRRRSWVVSLKVGGDGKITETKGGSPSVLSANLQLGRTGSSAPANHVGNTCSARMLSATRLIAIIFRSTTRQDANSQRRSNRLKQDPAHPSSTEVFISVAAVIPAAPEPANWATVGHDEAEPAWIGARFAPHRLQTRPRVPLRHR